MSQNYLNMINPVKTHLNHPWGPPGWFDALNSLPVVIFGQLVISDMPEKDDFGWKSPFPGMSKMTKYDHWKWVQCIKPPRVQSHPVGPPARSRAWRAHILLVAFKIEYYVCMPRMKCKTIELFWGHFCVCQGRYVCQSFLSMCPSMHLKYSIFNIFVLAKGEMFVKILFG